jgi:protein-tyrosine-phosphatase
VFYLALGYFVSYLPYAIMAKALSSGIVPGVDAPIGGLVLLPAAALGQLLVMPIFLGASGWWRFASERWTRGRSGHRVTISSAGVEVHTPGAPMTDFAYAVLQEAGVIPHRHRSRRLTPEMCRRADVIYCMTAEHRAAVLALAPDVADRTHCLAEGDIPEPSGTSLDDHRRTAVVIQQAVRQRLAEQFLEQFP